MRLPLLSFLALICAESTVQAQSVADEIPAVVSQDTLQAEGASSLVKQQATAPVTDPYTVTDVNADVTADHSGHARDQALMQAERAGFTQLCTRLGIAAERVAKFSDDDIASLVQSFDLQSERLSSVRYIGVFTIHFKQAAVQRRIGKYITSANGTAAENSTSASETKFLPSGSLSSVTVTVRTPDLAAWTQMKRRLGDVPQIAKVDVLSLGKGASRIALSYGGAIGDLQQAARMQGLVLRQMPMGDWTLTDGSMVAR